MLRPFPRVTIPRPTSGPLAGLRVRAAARRRSAAAFARSGDPRADGWRLGEPLTGLGDTCVLAVRDGTGSPAVLKAACSGQGRRQLHRQVGVLAALHADERLGSWARLVPRTLFAGDVEGVHVVLEERLPGTDARPPAAGPRVVPMALATIGELHTRTGTVAPLDAPTVDRWVRRPAAEVRAVVRGAHRAALDGVEAELVATLTGRDAARGWTHGDFNRTNVLLTPDHGHGSAVSGIVDWVEGEPDGLVGVDAVTLLLFEAVLAGRELGPEVLARLADPAPVAEVAGRMQRQVGGPELPVRPLLLLTWLRHVGANLTGSTRYAANPVWMRRNIRAVLEGL